MYYELNKTQARAVFKSLLGQANHFLITVLVGLNGVRSKTIDIEDEFRTSWNPQNVERSAERSRVFVLDLALVRAIDALDAYMMRSARKPCALSNQDFVSAMDASGRSVAKRFSVFEDHLAPLNYHTKCALELAIQWRNRRVHSLSADSISKIVRSELLNNPQHFRDYYSGLCIAELITHFDASEPPTFKEAAAVVRMCHEAVKHYDQFLLNQLDVEQYLKDSLLRFFEGNNGSEIVAIQRAWGHPKKKKTKVDRLLRMVGVNYSSKLTGREIPTDFINSIHGLEPNQVGSFLRN